MPFIVGGTGMYVDSVVRGYDFVPVEETKTCVQNLTNFPLKNLEKNFLSSDQIFITKVIF